MARLVAFHLYENRLATVQLGKFSPRAILLDFFNWRDEQGTVPQHLILAEWKGATLEEAAAPLHPPIDFGQADEVISW